MLSAEDKERKTRTCIMPVCAGERFDLVHRFPREDDRTKHWLDAVNLPHLYDVPLSKLRTSYFICSRHFRKRDYKNEASRHLNKTAVPCINLKSLDKIDEGIDRSVRRSDDLYNYQMGGHQSLTSDLDEDLDQINIPSKKYMKNTLGYREKSLCLEVVNVEILPKIPMNDKLEDGVERFVINVVDNKKLPDESEPEYCSDTTVLSDYGIKFEASKEISDEIRDSEEREQDEDEIEHIEHYHDKAVLQTPATPKEAQMVADLLEIKHPKYPEGLKLSCIWLRDHCRCSNCYNSETHQRKNDILEIPLDVKPITTEIRDNSLWVDWSDGHASQYDITFLKKCQLARATIRNTCVKVLWDQEMVHQLDYSRVNFNNYLTDDHVAKSVVKSLLEFGFAFIEKVPPNSSMTEAAIRRLFPIHKTFFGEMWTFTDEKTHNDTAYSNEFLGSHTDNTYWNDAAGLQILHCIKHSGSGGETILTDGYKIVDDFEIKDPKGFICLSTTHVPSEYLESGVHYSYTGPIIRVNTITNRPEQIRYNIYDRAIFNTLSQSEMHNFYKSLYSLAEEINREENQWRFKLNPGTVLIFDNWRILHGRERYTGKRQITGCYVARCEFLNVARVLGLIS